MGFGTVLTQFWANLHQKRTSPWSLMLEVV